MPISSKAVSTSVLVLVVTIGSAALAQSQVRETSNIQTNSTDLYYARPPDTSGPVHLQKNSFPASGIVRLRASGKELQRRVDRMQKSNTQLQSIRGHAPVDLENIMARAEEIFDLALSLHEEMGLPPGDGDERQELTGPVAERLSKYTAQLDATVKAFTADGIVKDSRTVDANAIGQTNAKLRAVIALSSRVAETARSAAGVKSSKRLQSGARDEEGKAAPTAYLLQLDLNCDLWQPEMFTGPAAKAKAGPRFTVNGVKLQVNYYQLAQEQIAPLGNCIWQRPARTAATDSYALAIKDFTTYEVKGQVLAYQATYQILRSRNGKTSHMGQPLYLYYIDEGGRGAFDLYTGNKPLTDMPDWARQASAKP